MSKFILKFTILPRVFADLCRFICINKKKVVTLRAFCASTHLQQQHINIKNNTKT